MARRHAGYETATAAAHAYGWNVNTYRSHENGVRGFRPPTAEQYAKAFGVPAGWLLTGENAPSWIKPGSPKVSEFPSKPVPVVAFSDIENMANGAELSVASRKHTFIPADPSVTGRVVCLVVEDDSMVANPPTGGVSFSRGDFIFVDLDAKAKPGDFVIAKIDREDMPVFRRYQHRGRDKRGRDVIDLAPLNQDYATVRIDGTNPGRILGRMVMHTRRF